MAEGIRHRGSRGRGPIACAASSLTRKILALDDPADYGVGGRGAAAAVQLGYPTYPRSAKGGQRVGITHNSASGGRAWPCYLSIITLQDLDLSLQPAVSF